jgi:hypothetical protein
MMKTPVCIILTALQMARQARDIKKGSQTIPFKSKILQLIRVTWADKAMTLTIRQIKFGSSMVISTNQMVSSMMSSISGELVIKVFFWVDVQLLTLRSKELLVKELWLVLISRLPKSNSRETLRFLELNLLGVAMEHLVW